MCDQVGGFIPRVEKFAKVRIQKKCNSKKKNTQFVSKLDDLFDISNANALDLMSNEEDRAFSIAQRQKGRTGSLLGIDQKTNKKE